MVIPLLHDDPATLAAQQIYCPESSKLAFPMSYVRIDGPVLVRLKPFFIYHEYVMLGKESTLHLITYVSPKVMFLNDNSIFNTGFP